MCDPIPRHLNSMGFSVPFLKSTFFFSSVPFLIEPNHRVLPFRTATLRRPLHLGGVFLSSDSLSFQTEILPTFRFFSLVFTAGRPLFWTGHNSRHAPFLRRADAYFKIFPHMMIFTVSSPFSSAGGLKAPTTPGALSLFPLGHSNFSSDDYFPFWTDPSYSFS